ncbi:MAG: hypothetical protein KDC55_03405 [Ignavibacteriae bacterium]|nr:hypothetical protein [Ignavibacteriota bacterium]MCB9222283.1 hypothetical protein [Ignavibacteria bacterium]
MKYLIYTFGFIYLLISFNYGINIYDEGIVLVGGMRVLAGDLPYLDFWTIYSPAVYYFSAFLQLISHHIWLHKIIAIAISFVIALQLNTIFKILTNKNNYAVFIATIILSGFGIKYLNPSNLGLMISLFSVIYILKYFKSGTNKYILKSSLLISLTALIRHDFALYLFVPITLSLLFDINNDGKVRKFALLLLGLIPALLIYSILGLLVGFSNMIEQIIIFPLTEFSTSRALPFPLIWEAKTISDSISNYVSNLWVALVFLFPPILAILNYIFHRKHLNATLYIYYGLLVLLFYNQALNRSDYIHLLPSLLISLPILFSILYSIRTKFYKRTALIVLSFLLFSIPIAKKIKYAKQNYKDNEFVSSNLERMKWVYMDKTQLELYENLSELNEKIIKGEPTFIGLKNMSSIEVNDVLSYYILGLVPTVKYHELHPGIADKSNYQYGLLKSLFEENKYIILLDINSDKLYNDKNTFTESLEQNYRYIIKSRKLDLLLNKSTNP